MFTKMSVYCQACGRMFETDFKDYDGSVCSKLCFKELTWRRILSTMGKEYEPQQSISSEPSKEPQENKQ